MENQLSSRSADEDMTAAEAWAWLANVTVTDLCKMIRDLQAVEFTAGRRVQAIIGNREAFARETGQPVIELSDADAGLISDADAFEQTRVSQAIAWAAVEEMLREFVNAVKRGAVKLWGRVIDDPFSSNPRVRDEFNLLPDWLIRSPWTLNPLENRMEPYFAEPGISQRDFKDRRAMPGADQLVVNRSEMLIAFAELGQRLPNSRKAFVHAMMQLHPEMPRADLVRRIVSTYAKCGYGDFKVDTAKRYSRAEKASP